MNDVKSEAIQRLAFPARKRRSQSHLSNRHSHNYKCKFSCTGAPLPFASSLARIKNPSDLAIDPPLLVIIKFLISRPSAVVYLKYGWSSAGRSSGQMLCPFIDNEGGVTDLLPLERHRTPNTSVIRIGTYANLCICRRYDIKQKSKRRIDGQHHRSLSHRLILARHSW